jgi:hypothetical protein
MIMGLRFSAPVLLLAMMSPHASAEDAAASFLVKLFSNVCLPNAGHPVALPTKNTRHNLIGRYSPENPREKRVIADFGGGNANFYHFPNKPQFSVFESRVRRDFSTRISNI